MLKAGIGVCIKVDLTFIGTAYLGGILWIVWIGNISFGGFIG